MHTVVAVAIATTAAAVVISYVVSVYRQHWMEFMHLCVCVCMG